MEKELLSMLVPVGSIGFAAGLIVGLATAFIVMRLAQKKRHHK